jgi:hypothetical protein
VLALGLASDPRRDLLRPWRDAIEPDAALLAQLRLDSRAG